MKTKIVLEFLVPTTSKERVYDALGAVISAAMGHKAQDVFSTIQGPFPDEFHEARYGGQSGSVGGLERGQGNVGDEARNRAAAEAFGEAGGTGQAVSSGGERSDPADGSSGGDDGKPKRGRGRPPKAGTASGNGDGNGNAQGGNAGQGAGGNVAGRAEQGRGGASGEGSGGARRSGEGGNAARGAGEADRVAPEAEESWDDAPEGSEAEEVWADEPEGGGVDTEPTREEAAKWPGDEWPDSLTPETVDETVIRSLLGEHHKASGGKSRNPTFDVMERVTGVRNLANLGSGDHDKLAKALLKDIARYEFGLQKPVKS